jgi:hypothetical protein
MGVSSQLQKPATLPPQKEPPVSKAGLDVMVKRKILPLLGIESQLPWLTSAYELTNSMVQSLSLVGESHSAC